ncbi:ABC transporter ATP-binding protein [Martelella endophytica]|uniref:ABC transporter n=1 Tax=Martelella endophytica TaxID=1486262 RepID=A0A0D5LMD7_MAREN|nr:sn-glycerol-3-phosphate ABC transporter ATP-binding protein UgpC [Martelella endophytica]AJY45125.1 ABC transporter [Martelella endophytica]
MSGVCLEGIVKFYGALEVVRGIDLEVREKEFVVLVGPSGCGKSTTLRMIAGLEEISGGTLKIGERVVNRVAPKDRDVAMVFQNYALYPHLSVAENIAFGLRIRRTPKDEIKKSVADVAEVLGLTPYLERRPSDLSGGQRQRVAMGRAIVRRPDVFLFDEPLSNLDAKLRTQMRAEVKRLHNRLGVTSIYVTHDQVEAMTLADRIVVMNNGMIEQIGAPMDLFNNPANTFVAGFIGSPPMNQMDATVALTPEGPVGVIADGTRVALPPLEALRHFEGRKVVIGVRPEHVILGEGGRPVPVELDLIETLGSEALLHTHVGGVPFVAKVETHGRIDHLKGVTAFQFPPDLIKVFDAETGRAFDAPALVSA